MINVLYKDNLLLDIDFTDLSAVAKVADLDWDIIQRQALYYDLDNKLCSTNHYHLLKNHEGDLTPLAIVGKDHKPMQPKELLRFIIKIATTLKFKIVAAGNTRGGKYIYGICSVGEDNQVSDLGFSNYLLISTSNDQNQKTRITPICFNLQTLSQLTVLPNDKKTNSSYTLSHHFDFDIDEAIYELKVSFGVGRENFFSSLDKLMRVPIEQFNVTAFHHTMFYRFNLGNASSKRKYDLVMMDLQNCYDSTNSDLPLCAQSTLLSLYISFNNYIDNFKLRRGGISSKIHSINFGHDEKSKRDAYYEIAQLYSDLTGTKD